MKKPQYFGPNALEKDMTVGEMRKEYARLRATAIKRLSVFERHGYDDTETVRRMKLLPPVSEIKDRRIAYELYDAKKLLSRKDATYSGAIKIQEATVSTLHKHGYDFVNAENLQDFGRYMERARAKSIGRYFDSVRAAEIFGETTAEIEDTGEEMTPDEIAAIFNEYEKSVILERRRAKQLRRKK